VRLKWCFISFLLLDEGPNFVALNVFDWDVDHYAAHDLFALLASHNQKFEDRPVMNAGNPLYGIDRATFHQQVENLFRLVHWRVHAVQGVVPRIGDHLAALEALVALTVFTFPEFPTFRTAVVANHCEISC
jgi:hypothetical protein